MTDAPRFTLRQLPLPAKLVVSTFLVAVGLGYLSAMVQLHMKHSAKEGEPLPTRADVVARFSGLELPNPDAPPPCSKIDALVSGDPAAPDVSKENMAPAFFAKSKGWAALDRGRGGTVQAERETERQALLAWVRADGPAKKAAYDADRFPRPDALKGKPLTPEFADGAAVKIKSLIGVRCQACHAEQGEVSLATYADLEPLVTPPSQELIDGKWVRSSKQITTEALTQSTHAHLLSFAVLFALTGLTFAFSTFPAWQRAVLGPVVLVAQVADISCWWLARVPGSGPYFAQAIMGTGMVVGVGLMLQILLSLFSMYGLKGRAVVFVLFVLGASAVGFVGLKVIQPALDEERAALSKRNEPRPAPANGGPPAAPPKVSQLERLIAGPTEVKGDVKWNGGAKGSMAAAFFDKDPDFKGECRKRGETVVRAEREGERSALVEWIRADGAKRKEFYDKDAMPLPDALKGKPVTADFVEAGAVKVRSLFEARCVICHSKEGEQPDYPLDTYEQILKYIDGVPKGDAKPIPMAGD